MSADSLSVFVDATESAASAATPLIPVVAGEHEAVPGLSDAQRAWVQANAFTGTTGSVLPVPGEDGGIACALAGIGAADSGDPCGPAIVNIGRAAALLPAGAYRLQCAAEDATLGAIAYGLGAYRFQDFKASTVELARIAIPAEADAAKVRATVTATYRGRDLINAPANALGPSEIAQSVVDLARAHDAEVEVHKGESAEFESEFP
ncbi:MAG: hypothetical protein AAFV26_09965, partial [Pseudomonadota bacterium]